MYDQRGTKRGSIGDSLAVDYDKPKSEQPLEGDRQPEPTPSAENQQYPPRDEPENEILPAAAQGFFNMGQKIKNIQINRAAFRIGRGKEATLPRTRVVTIVRERFSNGQPSRSILGQGNLRGFSEAPNSNVPNQAGENVDDITNPSNLPNPSSAPTSTIERPRILENLGARFRSRFQGGGLLKPNDTARDGTRVKEGKKIIHSDTNAASEDGSIALTW